MKDLSLVKFRVISKQLLALNDDEFDEKFEKLD